MFEDFESVTIITVQAILGCKPHKAPTVLQDVQHYALRKSLLQRNMVETNDIRISVTKVALGKGGLVLNKRSAGRSQGAVKLGIGIRLQEGSIRQEKKNPPAE